MMLDYAIVSIVGAFALIGLGTVIYLSWRFVARAWRVLVNLDSALREGVEVLKLHRGDIELLRQIQEQVNIIPNFGAGEPGPAENVREVSRPIPPFPTPVFDRFPVKPNEPDAPAEDVEMTPNDSDIIDQNRIDNLQAMGIHAEPDTETKPAGREVQSF